MSSWKVDYSKCFYCAGCVSVCPVSALTLRETKLECNDKCIFCKICEKGCPTRAITVVK